MLSLNEFFPSGVRALFTDRSVDFTLPERPPFLTPEQKCFLSERLPQGYRVAAVRQVHGQRIEVFQSISIGKNETLLYTESKKLRCEADLSWQRLEAGPLPEADGCITGLKDCCLTIRTADCLPVYLFDPRQGGLGLVHAGWRGTAADIAGEAVRLMTHTFLSRPADVRAVFGPGIRPCCYAVGPDFERTFPQAVNAREGRLFMDLPLQNERQLLRAGLLKEHIRDCQVCTCCDHRFFSYRRENRTAGRHLALLYFDAKAAGDTG